ncbi:MAG: hypothetical protein JXR73_07065 [Candidatus Omnitrophica bacterium]|nr:hypothetical protein [Candidatus Omnitrophota bacterium]
MNYFLRIVLKNAVEQRHLIELNRKIVVGERFARPLETPVSRDHIG